MKALKMCGSTILILIALIIELLSKVILAIGNWGIDTAIFLMRVANQMIR